ncbi:MAG TPA: methyltransferase domain-containing protein [Gemmatimonadaceae bacterium]|nr:methyltransferase domain-containing protein [Gemmatimonadaceae bacterium]
MPLLTPARQRGIEILDDPATPAQIRERSMADLALSNALFGGRRVAMHALRPVITTLPSRALLLDVGTGLADIPSRAAREAATLGKRLTTIGIDTADSLMRRASQRLTGGALVANALRLPLSDRSVDVVLCSQLLHHFEERDAVRLIAELHRVTRRYVVVCDLQRSWFAAAGWWLASRALHFHKVSQRDGVTSVMRGFTVEELRSLVLRGAGVEPIVRRGLFWRLSATWRKDQTRGGRSDSTDAR